MNREIKMKRIISSLLLLLLLAIPANAGIIMMGGTVTAAPACTSITVNEWQQLETIPTSGNWTKTGTVDASSSAERATIGCPGGTADTGSNGAAVSVASGTDHFITRDLNNNSVSIGFWMYLTAFVNYKEVIVVRAVTDPWGAIKLKVHTSDAALVAEISPDTSGTIGLSVTTWYWVTMKFTTTNTQLAIYNTSGTQVGSTLTGTAIASGAVVDVIDFGAQGFDTQTTSIYLDDILIDTTDATFPLGP